MQRRRADGAIFLFQPALDGPPEPAWPLDAIGNPAVIEFMTVPQALEPARQGFDPRPIFHRAATCG